MSTRLSKDFLSYRHTDCIVRYSKDTKVSMEEAERVFVETMKFLYASSQIRGCSPPSREVDNMWHTFLMFSADYLAFCALYAGRYLYHLPIENPDIAHRGDMEKLVRAEFGDLDSRYWAHLLGQDSTKEACSSGVCTNYCSESCNSNVTQTSETVLQVICQAGFWNGQAAGV